MDPADYDTWYDTPRGRWIGETEFDLLRGLLDPRPGERLLDVGCGTGWFTRRFAAMPDLEVTGIDANIDWLDYARGRDARGRDARARYVKGDALALPFADASFDRTVSVTALCFVADWAQALREIVRVTRKRFALGLLNRASLLYRDKGPEGGAGAYRGAHWHTVAELRDALATLPVVNPRFHTAVFLPSGSRVGRIAEGLLPNALRWGGFLVATGEIAGAGPPRGG